MDNKELINKIKDLCDRFAMPCPDEPTNNDLFKIVNSLFELRQMRNTKNTLQVTLSVELFTALRRTTANKSAIRSFEKKIEFLSGGNFEASYIDYLQRQGREIIYKLGQTAEVISFFEGPPDSQEMLSLQMILEDMSVIGPTLSSPEARNAVENAIAVMRKYL